MDIFNGNARLQNNIMYALDWAIFLRHNIEDQLIPFMIEMKGEELFKSMLQPGGDPEEFANRIAKKSTRGGDQFVIGYEGMLTDENGKKEDAFIVKGYDRTQNKGVFLAQIFEPKEKLGTFNLVDNPIFISNPDLPFPIDPEIESNFSDIDLYSSGMSLKNGDQVGIFSHDNPSVVSNGIKNYLRGKLSIDSPNQLSGNFECAIAPGPTGGDFFKYTILRTIKSEKENKWIKEWEAKTGKTIKINCKYGEELWLEEYSSVDEEKVSNNKDDQSNQPKNDEEEHEELLNKYSRLNQFGLDAEFNNIASVPNARINVDCLKKMTALMEVYESKGIEMPNGRKKTIPAKPKSGCGMAIFFIIVTSMSMYFY